MKVWQRPEQPVAPQRKSKPIEEKESYRQGGRTGLFDLTGVLIPC
jgi:hypothetical protein